MKRTRLFVAALVALLAAVLVVPMITTAQTPVARRGILSCSSAEPYIYWDATRLSWMCGTSIPSAASLVTTPLPAANGGTGQTGYTVGDLLYASGASALSKLADAATGSVLVSGGVGVAPAWSNHPTLTIVNVPVGGLKIGAAGAEVATTFSAAEANAATTDVASSSSTITLGVAAGTVQTATIQLKDANGTNIAAVHRIVVYMATDAAGATPSVAGANGAVTATTGVVLKAHTAKLHFEIVTDANGVAVISFDNAGGAGAYTNRVVLVLPTGKVVVSAALAVPQA